jgi:hypothetical protein
MKVKLHKGQFLTAWGEFESDPLLTEVFVEVEIAEDEWYCRKGKPYEKCTCDSGLVCRKHSARSER